MIKTVIFDWGGVIAPNPDGGWLNVLARQLGISLDEALPYWRSAQYTSFSKGYIDEQEFWDLFEKAYGQSVPGDDKHTVWLEGSALTSWPEMLSFVEELRAKHISTAVLSNTVKPMSKLARAAHLYDSFDHVVLSDEIGLVKPDIEIYRYAIDKLGVKASECIYVDDLPNNLVPAKDLGMHTVLATDDPAQTISDISRLLDK